MSVLSRSLFATRCVRVAAWLVLLLPGTLQAGVVINPLAWGLNPGDTFRLVVVTAGGTTGVSTSASDYDTFVNSQGLAGITYDGASLQWQAIVGTPSSNPRNDATRFSSQANAVRVYNLNGGLVSNPTISDRKFWQTSGQHLAAIDWTINGSGNLAQVSAFQFVWTGFDRGGSPAQAEDYDQFGSSQGTVTAAMGEAVSYNDYEFDFDSFTFSLVPKTLYPFVGRAGALANGWAAIGNDPLSTSYPVYAMSGLITVTAAAVPEPSTWALALAGLTCFGYTVARRRPRA
jgi:hypothetical protein